MPVPPLFTVTPTATVLTAIRQPAAWLSPEEQARAATFVSIAARDDFVAAHLLVRIIAAAYLAQDATALRVVQRCQSCGGAHGRPSIDGHPDVWVSISHTDGVVAAAVADTPIAIDIEECVTHRPDFSSLMMAPAELSRLTASAQAHAHSQDELGRLLRVACLRTWIRKEAMVKLGLLELDSLRILDLSALGCEQDWLTPQAWQSEFGAWTYVDFVDPSLQVIGTVAHHAAAVRLPFVAGDAAPGAEGGDDLDLIAEQTRALLGVSSRNGKNRTLRTR